jgi:hypothetical protein
VFDGLVRFFEQEQGACQVIMGLGEIRSEADRLLVVMDRVLQLAQACQVIPLVVMSFGELRKPLQALAQASRGRLGFSLAVQHMRKMEIGNARIRGELDTPLELIDCVVELALAEQVFAEQKANVGVGRVCLEDFPVEGLGSAEVARLLEPLGVGEGLRADGHERFAP